MSEKITFLLKYIYKLNKINENYFLKTTEKKYLHIMKKNILKNLI